MRSPPVLLAVGLLLGGLPGRPLGAQTPVVDPQPYQHLLGARQTGFPFGYPNRNVLRYLQVHDGLRGTARTIHGVAFRRSPRSQVATSSFRATVTLALSTSPRTAATIAPLFADNIGSDRVVLLNQAVVDFPATPVPQPEVPTAFEFALPGTQPFAYSAQGPLCLELLVHTHNGTNLFTFDLYEADRPQVAALGLPCGGTALATALDGNTVRHTAASLPPGAPALFAAGVDLSSLNGTPLPWDLTAVGAPGCMVMQAPVVNLLGLVDPAGNYVVEFPAASIAPGLWYSCQVAVVQPGLNALGLVLTQANLVVPQTARSAGRVWAEDTSATSGQAQPVFALVTQFF